MHAPAIDGIDAVAADFGIYFLNAESYVVDDDIEITSTSDAELEFSSSAIGLFALDTGLDDECFESGSIIFAIENFNGKEALCCCCDCWTDVFDGEIVIIGGDDMGDAVSDCVLFDAVSIIGLFDVNGTPDGLRGCMPEEICNLKKKKKTIKNCYRIVKPNRIEFEFLKRS